MSRKSTVFIIRCINELDKYIVCEARILKMYLVGIFKNYLC